MIKEIFDPQANPEISPPDIKEHFERYLTDFSIEEKDLKDKTVLDVGSGTNPLFAKYCTDNNISNVVSVDHWKFGRELDWYDNKSKQKHQQELGGYSNKKHIQAKAENLPFKPNSADLMLMRAAITPELDFEKLFEQLNILKSGGEFRIFPVFRADKDRARIEKSLSNLDTSNYGYSWQEQESYKVGDKTYYKDLLIIRKK